MKVATISVTKESKPLGVNFIGRDCECNITIPSKVRLCKYYLSLFFFLPSFFFVLTFFVCCSNTLSFSHLNIPLLHISDISLPL